MKIFILLFVCTVLSTANVIKQHEKKTVPYIHPSECGVAMMCMFNCVPRRALKGYCYCDCKLTEESDKKKEVSAVRVKDKKREDYLKKDNEEYVNAKMEEKKRNQLVLNCPMLQCPHECIVYLKDECPQCGPCQTNSGWTYKKDAPVKEKKTSEPAGYGHTLECPMLYCSVSCTVQYFKDKCPQCGPCQPEAPIEDHKKEALHTPSICPALNCPTFCQAYPIYGKGCPICQPYCTYPGKKETGGTHHKKQ